MKFTQKYNGNLLIIWLGFSIKEVIGLLLRFGGVNLHNYNIRMIKVSTGF